MNAFELPITSYQYDEPLLAAVKQDGGPRLSIYQPTNLAVVLGKGSDPGCELRLDRCLADRVPILRRRGGGCAVVIDPGNVIVSVAVQTTGINNTHRIFDSLTFWLVARLRSLGYNSLYHDGKSDIVLDDRKIGGSCVYQAKGLLYYSATLLVAPNIDNIERYLQHPPREPAYRRGRAHADFLSGLTPGAPAEDVADFARKLSGHLYHRRLPLPDNPDQFFPLSIKEVVPLV
jgi:lipoate-protein ligase A